MLSTGRVGRDVAPDPDTVQAWLREQAESLLKLAEESIKPADAQGNEWKGVEDACTAVTAALPSGGTLTANNIAVAKQLAAKIPEAVKDAHAEIQNRRKGRVLTDHKLALQQLAKEEPLPQDRLKIDQIGQEIALLTTVDLPGDEDLGKAETAVLLLRKAIEDAQLRLVEDKKRRDTERSELMRGIDNALQDVDPEVMEPEKSKIPLDAEKIRTSLPESPSDEALAEARKALDELKKLILEAAARVLEERKKRAALKLDVLKRVAEAKLSTEATGDEALKGNQLSSEVTSLLTADPPSADALEKAEQALLLLKDFVAKTNDDITSVRKVRFALALEAGEKFAKLSVEPPPEYPGGKPELIKARETLEQDLKPFLDWAEVTTWEAPALELVANRIEPLGQQFEAFRQEVNKALDAIRIASEAVTDAIAHPKDGAFSQTQTSHFESALNLAVIDAKKDVLAATPPIEKIKTLLKQVEAVARVRNDLLKRLKVLPTPAPVTATPAEQSRWGQLREAAVRAADEVVDGMKTDQALGEMVAFELYDAELKAVLLKRAKLLPAVDPADLEKMATEMGGVDKVEAMARALPEKPAMTALIAAFGDAKKLGGFVQQTLGGNVGAMAMLADKGCKRDAAKLALLAKEFEADPTVLKTVLEGGGLGGHPEALAEIFATGCAGNPADMVKFCKTFDDDTKREKLRGALDEGGLGQAPAALGSLAQGDSGVLLLKVANTADKTSLKDMLLSGGMGGKAPDHPGTLKSVLNDALGGDPARLKELHDAFPHVDGKMPEMENFMQALNGKSADGTVKAGGRMKDLMAAIKVREPLITNADLSKKLHTPFYTSITTQSTDARGVDASGDAALKGVNDALAKRADPPAGRMVGAATTALKDDGTQTLLDALTTDPTWLPARKTAPPARPPPRRSTKRPSRPMPCTRNPMAARRPRPRL